MNRLRFLRTTALLAGGLSFVRDSSGEEPQRNIRAAVIGHTGRGDYGHGLETIFAGQSGIELVALADPDATGRANTAKKIGAARQYADYRQMLERERPELVSVAMRHADLHYEVILASLRQGAHVYCEKPFTTTPAEADQLLEEARRRGLRIAVAHTMRMTPVLQRLKAGILEGLLGDLIEMRGYGKQDSRAGGEDLMVLGTHVFDLMRLFAGDPLWCSARVLWKGRDIAATDGRLVPDNVGLVAGDTVYAQFAFPGGVQATFTSVEKLRLTTEYWGIEFHGSKAVARILCGANPAVLLRQSNPGNAAGKTDQWVLFPAEPEGSGSKLSPPQDWLEAIRTNREPECSGANGRWTVEMVMAVYQAALSGSRVTFPLKMRGHPLVKS